MTNIYDQIDICTNILFDFMYNKKSNKCYTFQNIARNELSNLKKERDFDYTDILSTQKVKFLGYYNDCWNFKRYSLDSYPTILSFGKYKNGKSNNDLNRGELYNIAMMYMAGEIVANERFRHVVLPIMFFDVVFKDLKKLNDNIANNIKGVDDNDEFYVLVSENYFETTTLNSYLDENAKNMSSDEWKVLMFQVIYALAKFHNRFAEFRHNKLDLDSILVVIRKPEEKFNTYTYGNTIFKIPNVGFDIKLTNFKYSHSSDYLPNTDALGTKDNPYYDVHYFIQHIMFKKQSGMIIPQDVLTFVNSLLPSKYVENDASKFTGLDENKFDSNSSEIVAPSMIIRKNKFFSDFITTMADLSASPVELRRINIEKLKHVKNETRADLSITDASSDAPRLLGRKVSSKRKKSNEYYKNDMKGLRKIVVPNFNEGSTTNSDSNFREKVTDMRTTEESGYESEIKRLQGELRKKFDTDSQSGGRTSVDIEVYGTDSDTDSGKHNTNRLLKSIKTLENMSRSKRKHKDGTHSKKSEKYPEKKSKKTSRLSHSSSHSASSRDTSSHSTSSHSTSSHSTSSRSARMSNGDKNIYNKYIDSATRKAIDALPEGYVGEVPDHIRAKLPFDNGMGGMAPSLVDDAPPMGNVPPPGMMAQMAANMGNGMGGMGGMGNVPMGNVPMGNVPMGNMHYMNEGTGLDTAQPYAEGYMNMGRQMPMNVPAEMYPPGMPQMGMQQMGMPQMGMQQMGMQQMGMPQMGMPQMGMPQMGMPQMGMPQMGGSHKYKIMGGQAGEKNNDQKKKDFFF